MPVYNIVCMPAEMLSFAYMVYASVEVMLGRCHTPQNTHVPYFDPLRAFSLLISNTPIFFLIFYFFQTYLCVPIANACGQRCEKINLRATQFPKAENEIRNLQIGFKSTLKGNIR